MKINIFEQPDGTEKIYIRGDLTQQVPYTAEYTAADGKVTHVRVYSLKISLEIDDTDKGGTHEQPGS